MEWETLETKLDDIPLHPLKKQNVNDEEIAPKKRKVQRSLDFLLCDEPDDSYEETELSLYKCERCDPNVNPLKWWKENSIKYPRLSVLARQYLSIPGTFVPSECKFSATGLLVNKLRNRLP